MLKPYLQIFRLVWPLAFGMVNTAVLQLIDRAMLARESMLSLEAVLPASVLAWTFLGFFQSLVGYSGVFVAQYHGRGDTRGVYLTYRTAMRLAGFSGLAALALIPVARLVLAGFNPSPELLAAENAYCGIFLAGSFFVCAQMAAAAYFTGCGRTPIVFWTGLLGNVLNGLLDALLIFGFSFTIASRTFQIPAWGIRGAAIATVISLAVQGAILAVAVRRDLRRRQESLKLTGSERDAAGWVLGRILRYGLPSGGYAVLNLLSFTIFVFVTGQQEGVAFAASNACFTINYLLFSPMEGFALGAQTLVGQHLGRNDAVGAARAARQTAFLAILLVLIPSVLTVVFYRPILELFAPADQATAETFITLGRSLILLMSAWLFFDAISSVTAGALKGAGDTRFVFIWTLLIAFGFWLPLVWYVSRGTTSMTALWQTIIYYTFLTALGLVLRWKCGKWRAHRLLDGNKR